MPVRTIPLSEDDRNAILDAWCTGKVFLAQLAEQYNCSDGFISKFIGKARVDGDPRALNYKEIAKLRRKTPQPEKIEAPRSPSLAEQLGIRIGRVIEFHDCAAGRVNRVTLSAGLVAL